MERSAVEVEWPAWAPLTLLLLLAAFIGLRKPGISYSCIALSIIVFPFLRPTQPFGVPLTKAKGEKVVEQLLTHVYHAFDYREESAIYDQLAISVAGDQLTEIYLGQRRALELENRGGARARVESVSIEGIDSISKNGDQISIDAQWTVSGSVNHFGHTHYRQNAYNATLHLTHSDQVWKIVGIDVHEEERVY